MKPAPFYPHHWRLLAGAVVVVSLYVLGLYGVPLASGALSLRDQAAALEQARLSDEAVRQRRARLVSRWEALLPAIPSLDAGGAGYLELLQATAASHAVTLREVRPGKAARSGTRETLPLSLVATGRFHGLAAFVAELEGSPRLVTLRQARLSQQKEDASALRLEAELSVITFLGDLRP